MAQFNRPDLVDTPRSRLHRGTVRRLLKFHAKRVQANAFSLDRMQEAVQQHVLDELNNLITRAGANCITSEFTPVPVL